MDENQITLFQIMMELDQNPELKSMVATSVQNPLLEDKMLNILNKIKFNPIIRNQLMMKINPEQNLMNNQQQYSMMNFMKVSENINDENNLLINFKIYTKEGEYHEFKVKCTKNEKVSDIIERYRNMTGDTDKEIRFIINAINLVLSKTVNESGITNNSTILVFPLNPLIGY